MKENHPSPTQTQETKEGNIPCCKGGTRNQPSLAWIFITRKTKITQFVNAIQSGHKSVMVILCGGITYVSGIKDFL
jgi:hypothetical protein